MKHPPFNPGPATLYNLTMPPSAFARRIAELIELAWARVGVVCKPVIVLRDVPGRNGPEYDVRLPDGWINGMPPR